MQIIVFFRIITLTRCYKYKIDQVLVAYMLFVFTEVSLPILFFIICVNKLLLTWIVEFNGKCFAVQHLVEFDLIPKTCTHLQNNSN